MPGAVKRIRRINDECSGVWASYGITSWERERLKEWETRDDLTEGQERILAQIEAKAFPEEHDGED